MQDATVEIEDDGEEVHQTRGASRRASWGGSMSAGNSHMDHSGGVWPAPSMRGRRRTWGAGSISSASEAEDDGYSSSYSDEENSWNRGEMIIPSLRVQGQSDGMVIWHEGPERRRRRNIAQVDVAKSTTDPAAPLGTLVEVREYVYFFAARLFMSKLTCAFSGLSQASYFLRKNTRPKDSNRRGDHRPRSCWRHPR